MGRMSTQPGNKVGCPMEDGGGRRRWSRQGVGWGRGGGRRWEYRGSALRLRSGRIEGLR